MATASGLQTASFTPQVGHFFSIQPTSPILSMAKAFIRYSSVSELFCIQDAQTEKKHSIKKSDYKFWKESRAPEETERSRNRLFSAAAKI